MPIWRKLATAQFSPSAGTWEAPVSVDGTSLPGNLGGRFFQGATMFASLAILDHLVKLEKPDKK
jgi:hypothetical protein